MVLWGNFTSSVIEDIKLQRIVSNKVFRAKQLVNFSSEIIKHSREFNLFRNFRKHFQTWTSKCQHYSHTWTSIKTELDWCWKLWYVSNFDRCFFMSFVKWKNVLRWKFCNSKGQNFFHQNQRLVSSLAPFHSSLCFHREITFSISILYKIIPMKKLFKVWINKLDGGNTRKLFRGYKSFKWKLWPVLWRRHKSMS